MYTNYPATSSTFTRRVDDLSPPDDPDLSIEICMVYVAPVTGWDPYDLHHLVCIFSQGWICIIGIHTGYSQHLRAAKKGSTTVHDLDRS